MCAVISIWQSFPTHIKVLYDCPYQMKNPHHIDMTIILWIIYRFILDSSQTLSYRYAKALWISYRSLTDTSWPLSYWYDHPLSYRNDWPTFVSRWWMTPHIDRIDDFSYWYDSQIPFGFITEISPLLSKWKHTDFFWIDFRVIVAKAHIDMTWGCRIDMMMTPLVSRWWWPLSYRNDFALLLRWFLLSYRDDYGVVLIWLR